MTNSCLCIDTTNHHIVVGLFAGGEEWSATRLAPREAFQQLFPAIREVLDQGNVKRPSEIVCLTGPGSFTGIRIGVSAARSLAQLWDVPVRGLNSMTVYACGVRTVLPDDSFVIAIDGKQNRFYAKVVPAQAGGPGEIERLETLDVPADALVDPGFRILCDSPELILTQTGRTAEPLPPPRASDIYRVHTALPHSGSYADLKPIYLRKDPAEARYPEGIVKK